MNYQIITVQGLHLQDIKQYFPETVYHLLQNGDAHTMAAVYDGTIAGVLAFDLMDHVLSVLWVMVEEKYRRQYIATSLLTRLMELTGDLDQAEFIRVPLKDEENSRYIETILERLEFDRIDEDTASAVYPSDRLACSPLFSFKKTDIPVEYFSELRRTDRNRIFMLLQKNTELNLALVSLDTSFDPELSAVYMGNDQVKSLILTRRAGPDLELSYVYLNPECLNALVPLLISVMDKAENLHLLQGRLFMELINPSAIRLAQKLLPGLELSMHYTMVFKM